MGITWSDSSEIVCGLVLKNRISVNSINASILMPPYDDVIRLIQIGETRPEVLVEKCGLNTIQTALEAEKNVNGTGEYANWITILEKAQIAASAAAQFRKWSSKLEEGKEIDWGKAKTLINSACTVDTSDMVPLSKIESGEVPFILTGWNALDEHLGGIPEVGVVLVAAPPGTGKTTFAAKLTSCYVKAHPDKCISFFSIEMILKEIATRLRETNKITSEEEERIILCETPVNAEEALSKASAYDNLGMIVIDFADLMITGETTESSMAQIYRDLMKGSKSLHVPIILLAQLSRNYQGGLPRPKDIRYTSLAEALSWMILMLYNPTTDFYAEADSEILPAVENAAYICAWKVRGGFRKHLNESPGAILTKFRGDRGWGDVGKWYSLRKES